MGRKFQRLRSKLGHVKHGVSSRVATTISSIRDKSYAYAGFPTRLVQDELSDPADLCRARYMQLRNTIVRALLVDEVTYEPSSLLKKSRKAVALITGADLVLVKMTSMTKASSAAVTGTRSNSAPAGAEASGPSAGSAASGSAGVGRAGLDAAAVAGDAHASVLAQHELNKLVRCEVSGDRLDLEFIVTGGAQFKVSAAALGLNTASSNAVSSGVLSSISRGLSGHLEQEEEEGLDPMADTDRAPDTADAAADSSLGNGAPQRTSSDVLQGGASHRSKQTVLTSPRSSGSSPAMLNCRVGSELAGEDSAGAAGQLGGNVGVHRSQHSQLVFATSPPGRASSALDSALFGLEDEALPPACEDGVGVERTLGSRTIARWVNRYSNSAVVGSPPVMNGTLLSSASTGKGFARGLGVRSASAAEEGSRSSFRPVKTDDGEYLVWVEAFSLTFSDPSLAEMAAELLRTGRNTMRQALDWLKQGLPFSPDFAVTHITQLSSRAGDEELRAGPTPWGTVLQLPASWAEAVASAELPDEQPLHTALEVPEGPAAFKVHLATPAGLAEATLLPELIAVLSQQPCTHGQVLAVPIDLALDVTLTDADHQQHQQEQEALPQVSTGSLQAAAAAKQQASVLAGGSSNGRNRDPGAAGEPSLPPHAAVQGAHMPAERTKGGSQSRLTWADQLQSCSYSSADAGLWRSAGGGAAAAPGAQRASSATDSTAAGSKGQDLLHSHSTPHLGQQQQLSSSSDTAAASDCANPDGAAIAEQDVQQQPQHGQPSSLGVRGRADSSSSMVDLQGRQKAGVASTEGLKRDSSSSSINLCSTRPDSSTGTSDEQRAVLGGLSGILRQSSITQLSFAAEVHAVLHVRLLLDTEDGSSMLPAQPEAAAPSGSSMHTPFAFVGAGEVLDDTGLPFVDSSLGLQQTITQTPSILQLGPSQPKVPTAEQQQLLHVAVALLAALLCALAILQRNSGGAALLVTCAALANCACVALALQPAWFRGAGRSLQRLLQLQPVLSTTPSHGHHHHHHKQHHGPRGQHSRDSGAGGHGLHSYASVGGTLTAQRKLQGLRLQLLGGSFVKEALGLLEQQINAYRIMQEAVDSCSASYLSDSESDETGSVSSEEEEHEMHRVVFVSSPEPAWLTRDWRRRLWHARPTMEERRKLAGTIHCWRDAVGGDTLLQQLPPSFDWFQKHFILRPLIKTEQGHVVVLLKLSTLSNMHRMLAAAGLTPTELMHYCGFMWCWMFEEYARADWPMGRFVLLADMSGLKLGQAVGEGQVGGRALGEVCNAYPERLLRCLVLGAPNWFNMLYRLIRPQLSPSTRAKVQVCTTPAEAVAELTCCLGADWVPAEYGGPCTRSYDEYPGQQALLQHAAKLRGQSG